MTRQCENCGKNALVPDEIKPKGHKCAECIRQSRNAYNRAYHPAYYQRNRKKVLKAAKRYRRKNRQRILERQREYAAEHREESRERARRWYEAHRTEHNARVQKWKAEHPDLQREYQRWHYAKKKLDPAAWARYLEDSRMTERLLAERRGTPLPPLSEREYVERYGTGFGRSPRVPADPLLPFLRVVQRGGEVERLAASAGVTADLIHDALNAARPTIALVTADRLCAALDLPMSLIYQDVA